MSRRSPKVLGPALLMWLAAGMTGQTLALAVMRAVAVVGGYQPLRGLSQWLAALSFEAVLWGTGVAAVRLGRHLGWLPVPAVRWRRVGQIAFVVAAPAVMQAALTTAVGLPPFWLRTPAMLFAHVASALVAVVAAVHLEKR